LFFEKNVFCYFSNQKKLTEALLIIAEKMPVFQCLRVMYAGALEAQAPIPLECLRPRR
jgi:hypothetical protein